jgi:hypothetical protein
MIPSPLSIALLSVLATSGLAQDVDNPLPAANLTADPIDRNLTTIQIPLDPSIPDIPSFTNSTPEAEINQTVSYFVAEGLDNTPLAIIHGDIILSTVPDLLLNANPANTTEHSIAKRALSIFKYQNVWPGGIVAYKWQSEDAKGAGRLEAWTEATKRWTDMLPWLKFQQFSTSATLEDNVLTLVPTTGQFACFSPIGKAYGAGSNQMVLDDSCGGAGTYAHELGHSMFFSNRTALLYLTSNNIQLWAFTTNTCAPIAMTMLLFIATPFGTRPTALHQTVAKAVAATAATSSN